jgi:monothiol glutaredoxin
MTNPQFNFIQNTIDANDVVLFVKGTEAFPQCGFSSLTISIFKKLGVPFICVNVLESIELRQAIKDFSDWPTIPQIYVKGQFIGGSDIAKEMFESGELKELLTNEAILKHG